MPIPNLTSNDFLEIEKELYRRSLSEFVKAAWPVLEPGVKYVHGWHIDAMCEHLEAVTNGEITRLLINVPPGTMKSMLTSILWPAWEWGAKSLPHHRVIGASHEQSLSIRDTRKMRQLITSDWFQQRWPITLTGDQNQKGYYENASTGFRQACAVASMTGKRGDRVILDDPHSTESALSDANRKTAIRVFKETLQTRLNDPSESAIVVIMQRLHEYDVSGFIINEGLNYEHLMLPMEFEPARKCTTSLGFSDPRTEDGELLFPERFPRNVVESDKQVMGSDAIAGQYQQRPAPRGGNIFKEKWFNSYKVLPENIIYKCIYADTAQKTNESNDYSVFGCFGKTKDGQVYMIDMIRGKWEAPELLKRAKAFYSKHKKNCRYLKVEDAVSGTGLIQQLKGDMPVKGITRTKDKITRAYDVIPYIESGFLHLPDGADWLSDFVSEVTQFPNAAHDDQTDVLIDAISDMLVENRINWNDIL